MNKNYLTFQSRDFLNPTLLDFNFVTLKFWKFCCGILIFLKEFILSRRIILSNKVFINK